MPSYLLCKSRFFLCVSPIIYQIALSGKHFFCDCSRIYPQALVTRPSVPAKSPARSSIPSRSLDTQNSCRLEIHTLFTVCQTPFFRAAPLLCIRASYSHHLCCMLCRLQEYGLYILFSLQAFLQSGEYTDDL